MISRELVWVERKYGSTAPGGWAVRKNADSGRWVISHPEDGQLVYLGEFASSNQAKAAAQLHKDEAWLREAGWSALHAMRSGYATALDSASFPEEIETLRTTIALLDRIAKEST
jgi:hypothetical protein